MNVLLFYANAGAGHRAAAEALAQECAAHESMRVVCRDALDFVPTWMARAYTRTYLYLVRRAPKLWGMMFQGASLPWIQPLLRPLRGCWNAFWGRRLAAYVQQEAPDVVVCLHFFSAEVVARLRRRRCYLGTLLVVVTDFVAHRFWINAGTDYYFVAGQRARQDVMAAGVAAERVLVTGIPIRGKFHVPVATATARQSLGFSPDIFTVVVASGGFGIGPVAAIVAALDALPQKVQLIIVCGANKALEQQLRERTYRNPTRVFGFVTTLDEYMSAADLMFSKSGGLTVSEAMAKALPLIIIQPIPGQELINARELEQAGGGRCLRSAEQIPALLAELTANQGAALNQMRARLQQIAPPFPARAIRDWMLEHVRTRGD